MTVNQILVLCLIIVLAAFVAVMAVMAVHAIELLKKTKTLVGEGQEMVEASKAKVDTIGDKLIDAAVSVAGDTAPVVKALGATAGGLTAFNLVSMVGRSIAGRGGLLAAMADRRSRKKTRKELKRSRKMTRKVNKQAKIEAKALSRSKKIAKKTQKAERKAVRKAARKAVRKAKKAEK